MAALSVTEENPTNAQPRHTPMAGLLSGAHKLVRLLGGFNLNGLRPFVSLFHIKADTLTFI
jgi:hypothetical protein